MMQFVWEHYWFKKTDFQTSTLAEKETTLDIENKECKKLYCTFCKNYITELDNAVEVDGEHTHTFSNPAGFTYTINCFQYAPGCQIIGESTSEHTWFNGYEWQIAICGSCSEHLGWLFSNEKDFFALISDRLTHTS